MTRARKLLYWFAASLAALVLVLATGFALLQTSAGRNWLATTIAGAISDPDFTVVIDGLHGIVPFRLQIDRIEISDRDGIYLTLHDARLDLSATALLSRQAHIRSLTVAKVDMARSSTAPSATPLTDYFRVPHLPVSVVLDRFAIDKLALAPPVLGEDLVAAVDGNAVLAGAVARVFLEMQRTDGSSGEIRLAMNLTGDPAVLRLQVDAADPTGLLVDRFLGRTDRPPLAMAIEGNGPLADWHGRIDASVGSLAQLAADLTLAVGTETALGLSGDAAIAPLLPAEFRPLLGDRITLAVRTRFGERTIVEALSLACASGALTGHAAFGGPDKALSAELHGDVPNLALLAGLIGEQIGGSAALTASVTGTESRPSLDLNLSGTGIRFASSGAERIEANISATPQGPLDDAATRITVAAKGSLTGMIVPQSVVVPSELGRDLNWSLNATGARDGHSIDLTELTAQGVGVSLSGSGRLAEGGAIEGRFGLSISDLRPFSGVVEHHLAGSIELEANAAREGTTGFTAKIDGSAAGLQTGIAAIDALLGGSPTLGGSVQRDPAGVLSVEQLALAGAALSLSGDGRFDPASNDIAAAIAFDLPRLKPLSTAIGSQLAGALSARLKLAGPLDRLQATAEIAGADVAAAGAKLDRFQLAASVPDLAQRKAAINGTFRSAGLDGTLALAAEQTDSELVLPRLRINAADTAIEGSLRVGLDNGLVRGSLHGRSPDLARWSKIAGAPLGGNIDFVAGLDARGGQSIDLSLTGTQLAEGAGSSRIGVGHLALTARFADIFGAPSGVGRLSLAGANLGKFELASASLALDAPRPGRFAFQGDAKGQPLTIAAAGEGALEPGKLDLRLTRLNGSLGNDRILLEQPVAFSRHGTDLSLSGLALDWGDGRITGNAAIRGQSLSLALNGTNLSIASGARLLGYRRARGTLMVATTIGGTLRAPQGHVSVNARDLTVAAARHSHLTSLGLGIDGNWNGRNLDLKGQVTGLQGDAINLDGSVPLLFTPAPLGVSVPPDGRLALRLQGSGQLEHLADVLPLGEDRVSGRFAADMAVGGTVASPTGSGRLTLSDARYENFATGAVLTKLQAEIVGGRDRFSLTSFSAADSANGSLTARGGVVLVGPSAPTADLSATLTNFRVAARDEVTATASGTVSVSGPVASPSVKAPLTIDRADINLPSSLPPNVVVLKVVEVNSKTAKAPPPAPANEPPALPATLDIKIDMPGNIFVRGHGLDSEWRGKLAITGTTAAPEISGSLEQIRGTVDLLGKTFTLTRGAITFDGSAKLDPVLDIVAEASTTDITAQVHIGGLASAPTVTLSSTPVVPQDEILSRVLFNRGVGQLSAGEGLQLAAAASTLAGGGPGVLDRLRSGLGLDWFKFGSGASGPTTGTVNPRAASGGAGSSTALSAGKYIAPGVSVGVSQGVSPPTSKVTVEIEVRPHLTIGGEAGQSGSTGIGVNYNYDY